MVAENSTGEGERQENPNQRFIDQGRQAQVDSDWIRAQASSAGLDEGRMVLGHALRTIVSDDANFYIFSHGLVQDPVLIQGGRVSMIERLDWEIGLDELPQPIRDRLRLTKTEIEQVDWLKKEEFEKAKSRLRETEREINTDIERDESLSSALSYYDINYQKVPALPTQLIDRAGEME